MFAGAAADHMYTGNVRNNVVLLLAVPLFFTLHFDNVIVLRRDSTLFASANTNARTKSERIFVLATSLHHDQWTWNQITTKQKRKLLIVAQRAVSAIEMQQHHVSYNFFRNEDDKMCKEIGMPIVHRHRHTHTHDLSMSKAIFVQTNVHNSHAIMH